MSIDPYENNDSDHKVEISGVLIGFDKVESIASPGARAYTDVDIKSAVISDSYEFIGAYGHEAIEECVESTTLEWARDHFEDGSILIGALE